jgi:hypothetical protein
MSRSPVFIIWVPHIDDRMPVIWDDAPGAQIRGVSHGSRAAPIPRQAVAQAGPPEAATATRSAVGRAKR